MCRFWIIQCPQPPRWRTPGSRGGGGDPDPEEEEDLGEEADDDEAVPDDHYSSMGAHKIFSPAWNSSQRGRWQDDVRLAIPGDVTSARFFLIEDLTHRLGFDACGVSIGCREKDDFLNQTASVFRSGVTICSYTTPSFPLKRLFSRRCGSGCSPTLRSAKRDFRSSTTRVAQTIEPAALRSTLRSPPNGHPRPPRWDYIPADSLTRQLSVTRRPTLPLVQTAVVARLNKTTIQTTTAAVPSGVAANEDMAAEAVTDVAEIV